MGSPRREGNTEFLLKKALEAAERSGAETDLINLAQAELEPCIACDICKSTGECAIYDDMPRFIEKIIPAKGIILASPVYFGSVTSQLKMFMDRTRPLRSNFLLKDKIGGAITVGGARNGGQETAINTIHQFLLIHDALVVGDGKPLAHYGGTGVGGSPGDVKKDEFGIETAENLGRNIARLIDKLE